MIRFTNQTFKILFKISGQRPTLYHKTTNLAATLWHQFWKGRWVASLNNSCQLHHRRSCWTNPAGGSYSSWWPLLWWCAEVYINKLDIKCNHEIRQHKCGKTSQLVLPEVFYTKPRTQMGRPWNVPSRHLARYRVSLLCKSQATKHGGIPYTVPSSISWRISLVRS